MVDGSFSVAVFSDCSDFSSIWSIIYSVIGVAIGEGVTFTTVVTVGCVVESFINLQDVLRIEGC